MIESKKFDEVMHIQERIAHNINIFEYCVEEDETDIIIQICSDYEALLDILSHSCATNEQIACYLAGIISLLNQ